MSLLEIHHETVYEYRRPVQFGPHRLVLRPREGHDIRVERMELLLEPEGELIWSRDVFGNSVATAWFEQSAERLRILNRVTLRQSLPFPATNEPAVPKIEYPVQYSELDAVVASAYRVAIFPDDVAAVTKWLEGAVQPAARSDALALAHEVTRSVRASIDYARRETKGVQSPAETLALRSGSCRDMATLLLEAWRVLGFATRFASGYLDCAASEAARASTHAWAEVYLPTVGWTGFDPTSGAMTGGKHVVTGVSNHPRGVMPVTGAFYGDPEDYVTMNVAVQTRRVPESEAAPTAA